MTRLTFLGTGTSQGIPLIGCTCDVCTSEDSRDKRLRTSAYVEYNGLNILVDAGPDFRSQMLQAKVRHLDAILLTHSHKDHTGGLDDVRAFNYIEGLPAEIFCEEYVEKSLKEEYSYAFSEIKYPGVPEWHIHRIENRAFEVKPNSDEKKLVWVPDKGYEYIRNEHPVHTGQRDSVTVVPIRGMHYKMPVFGFRFGGIGYCTDMNHIPDEEFSKLRDLDHFVINCVKRGHHISHYSIEEALEVARRVGARHTWLTHLSHLLPRYSELVKELPETVRPAYDGLVIESRQP